MAMEIENNDELVIVSADQETLLKEVTEKMKQMDLVQLAKCQAALAATMLKPIKQAAKLLEKAAKAPKRASTHLKKFREWKEFVHADAKKNGWPEFTSTKVDKNTKEPKTQIYNASILKDDQHVFPTADEKGKYKGITPVQASSLAKLYWSEKDGGHGTRKDLWDEFFAKFQLENPAGSEEKSSAGPKVVMSAADKQAQSDAKKAEREANKAKKDAEKEVERKKKAAEKLKELQEKAAQLQLAIESPNALPKKPRAKKEKPAFDASTLIEVVSTEAAKPAVSEEAAKPAESPKTVVRPKKAAVAAYVDTFVPDPKGDLKEWAFKGVTYWRSPKNALYDEHCDYLGTFDKTTATINAEVANPDDE